jgi:hypothetical protein
MKLSTLTLTLIISSALVFPHTVLAREISATRQKAICARVAKRFVGKTKQIERINRRLKNRFGFECSKTSSINTSTRTKKQPSSVTPIKTGSLPYTFPIRSDWRKHWNTYNKEIPNVVNSFFHNIEIVKDSSEDFTRFVRIHFPEGSVSPFISYNYDKISSGVSTRMSGKIPPSDELYFKYNIRVAPNFDYGDRINIPGLFGGLISNPKGNSRFHVYPVILRDGTITASGIYTAKDNFSKSAYQLKADGKWHTVEMHISLNGAKYARNGVVEIYLDGDLALTNRKVALRKSIDDKLEGVLFSSLFGTTQIRDAVKEDTYIDFADMIVSDRPISF